jgi:predicted PurR-regulated permease PerM
MPSSHVLPVAPLPEGRVEEPNERIAFHVALGIAVVLLLGVFWPFRYVLILAAMIAIVSRPVFEWITRRLRGRRHLAAALTTLGLLVVVLAPIAFLLQSATNEIQRALERVRVSASDSSALDRLGRELDTVRQHAPWTNDFLPPATGTAAAMQQMIADSADRLRTFVSGAAPDLVGGLLGAGLHVLVFVLAVASLLADGPGVTRFIARLSPLAPATTERLFSVFRHFAHNVIVASIMTAFVQGVIAAVGYGIAGADRVLLLGMLTMLGGFVPIVGTTIVWIPATVIAYVEQGPGTAVFLVVWSLLATTSVDNFVRPLLVRGDSGIHPFLVFLGIFGGMAWMGFPGLLMGPVIVAMFLALAHLRIDDTHELP